MTYIRLGNFFQLYSVSGERQINEGRYNNVTPGRRLSHDRLSYDYLSFIYQGAAKNRTGDNLEAQIVLSVNEISTGISRNAVNNRWHVRIYSAVMTPAGDVSKVLTTEDWIAASMTYDNQTLEILLSSGIDAVGANAPTRVLTRNLVGSLPTTANIQTQ